MIGQGKMGGPMTERLRRAGHEVLVYDQDPERTGVASIAVMVELLAEPRVIWVMVPAGKPTMDVLEVLRRRLSPGDIIVDGSNENFRETQSRAAWLRTRGIHLVDAGVSGGILGLERGYALMVGGSDKAVRHLMPLFEALKPEGPYGFVHAGEPSAGHFAKMVHNGIEYALMEAYAEGWELLHAARDVVRNPAEIVTSWQEGTIIQSLLLKLLCDELAENPYLTGREGPVGNSGEGRWTVQTAVDYQVAADVIAAALFARFRSKQPDPGAAVLNALRSRFGGHPDTGSGKQ